MLDWIQGLALQEERKIKGMCVSFPPSPPIFFNSLANCKNTSAPVLNKSADFGDIFKQDDQRTAVERNNVNGIKLCLCTGENMVNIDISRVVG